MYLLLLSVIACKFQTCTQRTAMADTANGRHRKTIKMLCLTPSGGARPSSSRLTLSPRGNVYPTYIRVDGWRLTAAVCHDAYCAAVCHRVKLQILYSSYLPERDHMSLSPRMYGRFVTGLCLFTITLVRNKCKRPSREPFIYYRPALIVDTTVRQQ